MTKTHPISQHLGELFDKKDRFIPVLIENNEKYKTGISYTMTTDLDKTPANIKENRR